MSPKKAAQTTTSDSVGFSAEERAKEMKAEARARKN